MAGAKTVRPYFEDEHGEPDTLPAQFVDPVTKYCQPYPHWKAPLTKQVVWIPTYILRFRSMIPKDRGELSAKLHSLSDEQIVTLLHDGPFKSAQNAWRDMKKTNEELEVMRMGARRYQRIDRVSPIRIHQDLDSRICPLCRRPPCVPNTSIQFHRCRDRNGNISLIPAICPRTRAMMKASWLRSDRNIGLSG